MTIQEFKAKREEFKIEGTGVDATVKKDKTWKSKTTGEITVVIPAGAKVHVYFSPDRYRETIFTQYGDIVKISNVKVAHEWLTGFTKRPTLRTLQKRSYDGISKTVTGKKVEPDGYSYDGSPSWELVLGII